jgi:hypothetical protein
LSRSDGGKFRVGEAGSALEPAAKFAETLGTPKVRTVDMDLFELGSEFGGAAIVTSAQNEIEKLFESRRMARRAAQNGFEKADGFLGQAVAGKEIDVREGLGDEFLGFFVKRGLGGGSGHNHWCARGNGRGRGRRHVGTQLRSRSLGEIRHESFFGRSWSGRGWFGCEQTHFAEDGIEFAFGGIAVRLAVDELFKDGFCAIELIGCEERIPQMSEGVRKAERVAGPAVEVDKPLEGLDAVGHAGGKFVLEASDHFVLAGVNHGDANLADDGHGAVALARFEEGFDDFLRGAKILGVGAEYAERKRGSLIPVRSFEIEIEEQLGLFATFFEIRGVFEEFGGLREIALRRKGTGFDDGGGQAIGVDLEGFVGKLVGFGVVAAGESTLGGGNIGVDGFARLAHGLIEIGEANLNAKIVGFREEKLFEEADGFRLAIILEMNFGELQEERAGFAHYALLDVKVGELFEGANFFRG